METRVDVENDWMMSSLCHQRRNHITAHEHSLIFHKNWNCLENKNTDNFPLSRSVHLSLFCLTNKATFLMRGADVQEKTPLWNLQVIDLIMLNIISLFG